MRHYSIPFRSSFLVLGATLLAPSAFAVVKYQITDLGTLGGSDSMAYGLNNHGQVVGVAATAGGVQHAFLWNAGTITDLGTLTGYTNASEAHGINDAGQIAGWSRNNSTSHAFEYQSGTLTDLGNYVVGRTSRGASINASGVVVGYGDNGNNTRATSWSSGTLTDLGSLSSTGANANSAAVDINASGQVAANAGQGIKTAFIRSGGTNTSLGTLGGSQSQAAALNDLGAVVGYSYTATNAIHAFVWQSGSMTDLGTIGGGNQVQANDINNAGQIVGVGLLANGNAHAFIYQGGVIADLNNFRLSTQKTWSLLTATGINSSGQIVGQAIIGGKAHAYLATPVPEPGTWAALGLGMLAMARRRNRRSSAR